MDQESSKAIRSTAIFLFLRVGYLGFIILGFLLFRVWDSWVFLGLFFSDCISE